MIKIRLVFNRKGKVRKDGTALIQWCLSFNGRYKYLSSNIRIEPKHWDCQLSKVNRKHPRAGILNRQLREQQSKIEDLEDELIKSHKEVRLNLFEDVLRDGFVISSRMKFVDFCEREIELQNIAESSRRQQKVTINKLRSFDAKASFMDITVEFCQSFVQYLKNEKNLNPNSIHKEIKNLKKFVNLAIDKGHFPLEQYPFRRFKVKSVATPKKFLSSAELMAIENLKLEAYPELSVIRDIYLLSCYTGLRHGDVMSLSREHLSIRENRYYLNVQMEKTKDWVVLPINELFEGKAKAIVLKYLKEGTQRLFKQMSNQHMNRNLKVLDRMAGLDKNLTFHSSRHTFGTSLLNMGLPKESVQALMGHRNLSQTEAYVKLLNSTIEQQLRSLDCSQ